MTFIPPTSGQLYSIRWRPHGHEPPPNGMNPVQFEGFALSSHPSEKPPEIDAFFGVHGYGSGWCCCVQSLSPPPKRRSAETRGKLRVKRLERRVAKTIGPMFADEVVQQALSQKPEYYQGKGDPTQEARIAQADAQEAALWERFQAWALTKWEAEQMQLQVPTAPEPLKPHWLSLDDLFGSLPSPTTSQHKGALHVH